MILQYYVVKIFTHQLDTIYYYKIIQEIFENHFFIVSEN